MPSTFDLHLLAALVVAPFVGSFVATLGLRLCTGRDAMFGRSACERCGTRLGIRDLVPIASYGLLRGRCRHCGGPIDPLHLAAELGALLVPLSAALVAGGTEFWLLCGLGWLLIAQTVADLRYLKLPDSLNLAILVLGFVALALLAPDALVDALIGVVTGFLSLAAVALLYERLRGRTGLGLGDAKLLGALGAWTGWFGLPSTVLIAAAAAGLAVVAVRVLGKPITATTEIPFAPFLALGAWIVVLHGPLAFG
ncbi:prepilin peptidase [Desertibaculum subflavum]|uniref:prepilin peptidase n=1 Tax=Desertibaculum subflavum TaxID=2268458 RepID=UPI0013C4F4B4